MITKVQQWINILFVLGLVVLEANMAISTRSTGYVVQASADWNVLVAAHNTGWIPADTLVYVSASSFKIVGSDVTATYTKGTRIKLTDVTVKYFVVTAVAYSSDTTVTVTGGTDYTLSGGAISSPFYSYAINPQGYPTWFSYTPTIVGFTTPPVVTARFSVIGNSCTLNYYQTALASSNATNYTVTAPINASSAVFNTVYNRWYAALGETYDNSAFIAVGYLYIAGNSNIIYLQPAVSGVWTASGNKSAKFQFTYEF